MMALRYALLVSTWGDGSGEGKNERGGWVLLSLDVENRDND